MKKYYRHLLQTSVQIGSTFKEKNTSADLESSLIFVSAISVRENTQFHSKRE